MAIVRVGGEVDEGRKTSRFLNVRSLRNTIPTQPSP
jgi:hypothetical protein